MPCCRAVQQYERTKFRWNLFRAWWFELSGCGISLCLNRALRQMQRMEIEHRDRQPSDGGLM